MRVCQRLFLCLFAALLFFSAFGARAAGQVELVTEFTLTKESPALYRAWARHDRAYKRAHPWSEVWKANCARHNVPCTESAWKKLPPGSTFYLPAPVIRVVAPEGVALPEAVAVVVAPTGEATLAAQVPAAPVVRERALVVEAAALKVANQSLAQKAESGKNANWVFGAIAALAVGVLFYFAVGRKKLIDHARSMSHRLSDYGEDMRDRMRQEKANTADILRIEWKPKQGPLPPEYGESAFLVVEGMSDDGQMLVRVPWNNDAIMTLAELRRMTARREDATDNSEHDAVQFPPRAHSETM